MSIDAIADALLQPHTNCAADSPQCTTLAVLANTALQSNGLALTWFVLHQGQIRGFKALIDPWEMDPMVPTIMQGIITILTTYRADEQPSAFASANIYPISIAELWESIVTRGRNPAEYAPLKQMHALTTAERQQIPRAVLERMKAHSPDQFGHDLIQAISP